MFTDNGKQFTGRFTKPRPAEVLFERVCRENGITTRLTKPRSPTTTGKIERWHQTLQQELLEQSEAVARELRMTQAAVGHLAQGVQRRPAAPVPGDGLSRSPVTPVPSRRRPGPADPGRGLQRTPSRRSLPAFLTPIPARHCGHAAS